MLSGLDAVSLKSIEDEARTNVDKVTLMNLAKSRQMKPDETHFQYMRARRNLNYLRRNAGKMLSEVVARHFENALALYKALPAVLPFHRSSAQTRLVVGSNKAGKAQPKDEPVLTPNGWVDIGSLRAGDTIIGGDGKPCMVMGVFPQGVKPVYKVTFGRGETTRCCKEHLWKVKREGNRFYKASPSYGKWDVMTLCDILEYGGPTPRAHKRVVIPTACVDFGESRQLPLDPYLLGVLLGDGGIKTSTITITTADSELATTVQDRLPSRHTINPIKHAKYGFRIKGYRHGNQRNDVVSALRELGLFGKSSHQKHVPNEYLYASIESRRELLKGLLDTDGTVSARRKSQTGGAIEFCTTSPQLAKDVEFLVRSLGGQSQASWRVTSFTHKGEKRQGRPSARVKIRFTDFVPFRLSRKAERCRTATRTSGHVLRSIVPDGEADCVCIAVSSQDNTYITRDFIVTHNSMAVASEVARIVRGRHPTRPKTGGTILCVGLDEDHLNHMWEDLLTKSLFKVVPDEITGVPRAVRPDPLNHRQIDPIDESRKELWRDAPPFIPPEEWDYEGGIVYRERGKNVPAQVRIRSTGWKMLFYPSGGNPRRGISVNECLAGWSRVYDPVAKEHRRIDEIEGPFHVWSLNQRTGQTEIKPASKPFIKGHGEICRVSMSNGSVMFTTRRHQVLSQDGEWATVQNALNFRLPLVSAPAVVLQSRDASSLTTQSKEPPETYRQAPASCAARTDQVESVFPTSQSSSFFSGDESTPPSCEAEFLAHESASSPPAHTLHTSCQSQERPLTYTGVEASECRSCGTLESFSMTESEFREGKSPVRVREVFQGHSRRLGRTSCQAEWPQVQDTLSEVGESAYCVERPKSLAYESECVHCMSVTPGSQPYCFDGCRPCDEPARVSSIDDRDAVPSQLDARKCGHFSMRRDDPACTEKCTQTHQRDAELAVVLDPSEPPVFIESIETCGDFPIWDISVPDNFNYVNDGVFSHNCWFDEEISNSIWFSECMARLIKSNGNFMWSATPQTQTEDLLKIHNRFARAEPDIDEFQIFLDDNPYMSAESKLKLYNSIAEFGEDELAVRYYGQWAILGRRVYNFDMTGPMRSEGWEA